MEYYIPHLEWEFSDFPIKINQLKFEKTNWGFSEDSVIEVWRDEEFRLRGKICGVVADFKKTEEVHYLNKGNIVKGQVITGIDISANTVELRGCFLADIQTSSLQISKEGSFIEGELILDSIRILFSSRKESIEETTRFDWFICGNTNAYFSGRTFRKQSQKKIRIGIDEHDKSIENYIGSSTAKDYVLISIPEAEFIVARVPRNLLPNQVNGLCLEFRSNLEKIDDNLLNSIKHFISFLLGNKIHHIGYSYTKGKFLKEAFLNSSNKRNLINPMPQLNSILNINGAIYPGCSISCCLNILN